MNRPWTLRWWSDHLLEAGQWAEGWAGQGRQPEHTGSCSRTGHPIDLLSRFPAQSDFSHSTTFASIARVRRVHCHRTKHYWKWQRPTHDSLRASAVSIKVKMQVIWQRKQSSVVIWLDGTRIAIPRNMTSTLKRDAVVSSSKHFDTGCYEFGS